MDLDYVVEMKSRILEELKRMEVLKQSMERTLAGLTEWEKQLRATASPSSRKGTNRKVVVPDRDVPDQDPGVKHLEPSPGDRVIRALVAIEGEFTRSQLLAQAEGDGKGEILSAAYTGIFAKLLKKNRIQCVKGNPRQRDSLYTRTP
jgi:hypothetical protein